MSLIESHGEEYFDGDANFTGEQAFRATQYFYRALDSLPLLTMSFDPQIAEIGETAELVQKALQVQSDQKQALIALEPSDTLSASKLTLFTLEPNDNEDYEDCIPPAYAMMSINVPEILILEESGLSGEDIVAMITLSLVEQNDVTRAYLEGKLAQQGKRQTARHALNVKETYDEYVREQKSQPTNQPTEPLGRDNIEERVKQALGDEAYFTDCTFDDFKTAAEEELERLYMLQQNGKLPTDDDITQAQITVLEKLCSDNLPNADTDFLALVYNLDVIEEVYQYTVGGDYPRIANRPLNIRKRRLSPREQDDLWIKAEIEFQRLNENTRASYAAEALIHIFLDNLEVREEDEDFYED